MSALGAVLHRDGAPTDPRQLKRMEAAMRMYGGDRAAAQCDDCVGVAWTHAAGYVPGDAAERQPIALERGGWFVFTGRIDHRDDLARALGVTAGVDGRLAALAWERWGERALPQIEGDWTLVAVDSSARTLTAARSPLRGRPLFYHVRADRVAVASMPKGLFALGDVPREVNETRIADFLAWNLEERGATYFHEIAALPLGHMLRVDATRVEVRRFYDLRDAPEVRHAREADYLAHAGALLDAAVSTAMRSDVTPAISLSSGLDSTSVAVTAHDLLADRGGAPLLGLVAVPEAGWDGRVPGRGAVGDERAPVEALMARYPALDVRFVDAAGLPGDHRLDALIAAADMPVSGFGNNHWGLEIARIARVEGRRVMLSGSSGNATFSQSGLAAVRARLFREGRWLTLLGDVRRHNRARGERRWLGLSGIAGAIVPALPKQLFAAYAALRRTDHGGGWRAVAPIAPGFAERVGVDARMAGLGWDDLRQPDASRRAAMAGMLDRGGRHESGAAILAYEAVTGVATRDPLGDRRLAEFCYGAPDDLFYAADVDRRLARRLMADRLPREVLGAPFAYQGADWHVRLVREAPRYDAELAVLARDPAVAERIDIARMRRIVTELPRRTPVSRRSYPELMAAQYGFGRALAAARFIRSVTGHND